LTVLRRTDSHTQDSFYDLAIDAAGNRYGTGGGGDGCRGYGCYPVTDIFGYIFKMAHGSDGWQWSVPVYFYNKSFPVSHGLAVDAQGNLYGATSSCGAYNQGTVWQLSP